MIPMPTNFPTNNNHRVALFLPDQRRDDFDHLEELTADGLKSARIASKRLFGLSATQDRRFAADISDVLEAVEKRRLLTTRFREASESIIKNLRETQFDCVNLSDAADIADHLDAACEISHRVCDLLAAEKDVGWHRGIS